MRKTVNRLAILSKAAAFALSCAASSMSLRARSRTSDKGGPDVDIPVDPKAGSGLEDRAGHALSSALRGAIPYRWALRWLTQAGAQDQQLRHAVMAGAARRGFLKGMRLAMACPVEVAPLLAPPRLEAKDAPVLSGPVTLPTEAQTFPIKSAERKEQASPR